ncbi:hypothetical protein ACRALDRAFT_2040968 [Sodiomyces alcalophilus JCM 7366]|uniref:uncharacterized protein n=1 Tax=Sodiomyces alcalophilus JCM 7366 TaxID=591952 RepID=UPI0039B6A2FD
MHVQTEAQIPVSVPQGTDIGPKPPTRPPFHTRITADRLREGFCAHRPASLVIGKIKKGRRSYFKELELDDDDYDDAQSDGTLGSPTCTTPTLGTLEVGSSSHAAHLRHTQSDSVASSETASPVTERDFDPVVDRPPGAGVDGHGAHMCEDEDGRMRNVEDDSNPTLETSHAV